MALVLLCGCSSLFYDTTDFVNGPKLVDRKTILTIAFARRGHRATDPDSWRPIAKANQGNYDAVFQSGFDKTADCYARRTENGKYEAVLVLMSRDTGATLEDDKYRGTWSSERFVYFWYR